MASTKRQDTPLMANAIRALAMDAVQQANSGHPGAPMGMAEIAVALWDRHLKHNPANPHWADRDRFVLSNGHGSMLVYALLHLTGYDLALSELRNFRQLHSKTPGHPEVGVTPGIETTTGPLGQGLANAVGMALAEKLLAAEFNRPGHAVVDHRTYAFMGDGCLMEGISHEAASLAGHLGLGKLICVFDDNHITIDGPANMSTGDDAAMRFRAYGWDVIDLDEMADDLDGLEAALETAKAQTDKPSLLILRSHIGGPSPDHIDTAAAHGNPFSAGDVTRTKEVMGIPDEPFWAPDDLVAAYRDHVGERGAAARSAWEESSGSVTSTPEWQAAWTSTGTDAWDTALPSYELGESIATRKAIQKALDATYDNLPGLMSGSADLTGSNGTGLARTTAFTVDDRAGRYIHFGIREHAMGAALVGMAQHGGTLPISGTFFVFSDYMRPSIRLAALSGAKCCFVFTHDSVGVGEDGPTHQPVEQLATLRAMPGLHVIRPADGNETIQAWADIVRHDGPSALILSRQNIRVVTDGSAVARGAGIVTDSDGEPDVILVGTGSEVEVCVDAADRLRQQGHAVRVVSLPSWDRFAEQADDFQDSIMPIGVPALSVEAATTFGWERWSDDSIGIDRFGASAPGELVLDKLGINVDNVVERATALLD